MTAGQAILAADHPAIGGRYQLRDYQQEALAAVHQAEEAGRQRVLLTLPTGAGKTVVFCAMIAAREARGRALIMVHRDELIGQAVDKMRETNPGVSVGVIKGGRNDVSAQVVVASVASLGRKPPTGETVHPRIRSLLAYGRFGTVIIDEAHHAGAATYVRAARALGCMTPGGPLLVGVTATPVPTDKHFAALFEEEVYSRDILWMIERGYLSDVRGVQVKLRNLDLQQVKMSGRDYQQGALGEALTDADAPSAAVAAWLEHAKGRKGILFAPTVELAYLTAETFRLAGVRAEAIHGEMDPEDRAAALARLRSGATELMCNVGILTEGFDDPSVDAVVLMRPTRSRVLYLQCIGRGLRTYPGKADCLILDLTGATTRHALVGVADALDLDDFTIEQLGNGRRSVAGAIQAAREEKARREAVLKRVEVATETVELAARFHWVRFSRGFALSMGDQSYLVMAEEVPLEDAETDEVLYRVGIITADGRGNRRLQDGMGLGYAQGFAEDFARRQGLHRLAGRQAGWRDKPASPGLVKFARQCGLDVPAGATAGGVGDLVCRYVVERAFANHRARAARATVAA